MKRYEFIVIEDGKNYTFNSTNEGFNAFEILGILEKKKIDILEQIEGKIKPDVINRTSIVDKSK